MRILKQFVLSLSIVGVMAAAGLPQPTHAEVQQRLAAASPSPRPAATSAAEARIENTPRQQESRLSDPLEKIAALARAASGKDIYGRTKPGNRPGAGDWNDALEIAKQIDAEVGRLANVDLDLEQDFADELAEVERRNLAPEMKQRLREAQQTIRQRLHDFRQITNRLNAAVRSGRSDEARAQVDALAEFLAKFDTARGAGPVDPASIRAVLTKPTARQPAEDGKSLQARLDTATGKSVAGDGVSKAAGPTAADLGESDEVQLTPAIRALAAELGNSPTRIVEWVTNNIEYLPTYGAIQGAQLTLTTRRGNAFDTNALLVALLRAANVPARFVYGTVEIPEAQVRNWVGNATSPLQAADVLTKGGIPTTILNSGGKPAAFRIEHVWVEAYVDYVPSRGAVNREGDTWVPLDASFKQYTYADPIDYVRGANVPAEQILTATFQTAERGPLGSITGIDLDYLDQQIEANMDSMVAHVQSVKPDANLDDILGRKTIVQTSLPMLAGTLPYRTVATTNRYAALPNGLKHYFEVSMFANPTDVAYDSPAFTHRIATVKLDQAPVYVKYAPATVTDEQGLAGYAEDNAASLPLSMFRVVPELHIGDAVVQRGGSTAMGTMHYWTAKMIDPSGASSQLIEPYRYAAGSHIAFVPNLQGITSGALAAKVDPLPQPSTMLPVHQALDLAGNQYWFLHDLNDRIAAAGWKGLGVRMPSVGAFAAPMNVRYFFGLPRTGYFNGYSADVKSVRLAASHTDQTKAARMVAQMGSSGSFAEGLTWDLLFGPPAGGSISAASIIAWANTAGVPIHTITRDNIAQVMPVLKLSADAKSEISDAVAAGFLVVAPEEEYRSRGWSGSGYVLMDPATGGAIYRVEGGLNGGINVGCVARAIVLQILCSSKLMRMIQRILVRAAVRFAVSIGLGALLGPVGVLLPIVAAVWTTIEIIMAVNEIYRWVTEIINEITSLTPEEMAELGIDAFNDALCNYMPICFGVPFVDDLFDWFGDGVADTVNNFVGAGGPDGGGVGNPIGVGSGAKYQTETDYIGNGPYPLRLERRYVSYLPNGSIFGHKWRGNYDTMLRLPPGADSASRADSVLVVRPEGALVQFNYRYGTYVANGDVRASLSRQADASGRTTGWKYRNERDETETFDADGKLLVVQHRTGLKHVLRYNELQQLVEVADDFGRTLRFAYDAETRQVTSFTDPDNKTYRYSYNEYGALIGVAYPDQTSRTYHYEVPGRGSLLTGITDERGVRYVSWSYDRRNRATESVLAGGVNRYQLAFGDNRTTVKDARGTERTYEFARIYDTLHLTKVTQNCSSCSAGGVAEVTYDGNAFPRTLKDFNGNVHTASFNSRGLPESLVLASGTADAQSTSMRWHSTWRLPVELTQTSASTGNVVTRLEYFPNGTVRTRSVTADGATRTWTYGYNSFGQLTSIDGPRTDVPDVTTLDYDATTGNLTSVLDPSGLVTRFTRHDPHGRVLETQDPNGTVEETTYDLRGRITNVSVRAAGSPDREDTRYSYDAVGNLRRVTMPDSSYLDFEYDDANRLVAAEDSSGNRASYTLNAAGDSVFERFYFPDGRIASEQSQAFDALGRLATASGSDAQQTTRFTYDGNGNVKSVLEPLRTTPTSTKYDALDRAVEVTDPTSGVTSFAFDPQNNLKSVTDPRQLVTRYEYNGFNELTRTVSPDSGTSEYGYDAAGNVIRMKDARGVVANLAYDASDRLVSISYPDEEIRYTYDEANGGAGGKGRLTSMVDSSGTTRFSYDIEGRVLEKRQKLGASASELVAKHAYSAGGLPSTLRLPSGAEIGYRYSSDGRVLEITVNGATILREAEYFPLGQLKSFEYGSSRKYERAFDRDGRIVEYTAGSKSYRLTYDAAERVVGRADAPQQDASWTYGYDQLNRLVSAKNDATAGALAKVELAWTYDSSGNRTSVSRGVSGGDQTLTPYRIANGSNRLDGAGNADRLYDAAGNTVRVGTREFKYSGRSRLFESADADGSRVRYTYNGFGERVCRATGNNTCPTSTAAGSGFTQYVYDDEGQLIGEYAADGSPIAEYVWLEQTPVAVLKRGPQGSLDGYPAGADAVFFVHADHLDAPAAVVNASGRVVWTWESIGFGSEPANANPEGLGAFSYPLRLPGQQHDDATGTDYNYFRDYDAASGRYIQSDPLGLAAGINTFAYALNNPFAIVDPLGLKGGGKGKGGAGGCGCGPGKKKKKKPHGHHSDPKVYGGDPDQPLTTMCECDHQNLHTDMWNYMDTVVDKKTGRSMRPKRGNSGSIIRKIFSRAKCLRALANFYRGPGKAYPQAAADFFKQHPRL